MQQISTEGMTRMDWAGNVIHWEMYMKFKENDTHMLLWDFDIYTDHLISVRIPALMRKDRILKAVLEASRDLPSLKLH